VSGKEDHVENVESRGPDVEACWISTLKKRAYRLTKRGSISKFRESLEGCREASENQNAFLLNDFNKIHEK